MSTRAVSFPLRPRRPAACPHSSPQAPRTPVGGTEVTWTACGGPPPRMTDPSRGQTRLLGHVPTRFRARGRAAPLTGHEAFRPPAPLAPALPAAGSPVHAPCCEEASTGLFGQDVPDRTSRAKGNGADPRPRVLEWSRLLPRGPRLPDASGRPEAFALITVAPPRRQSAPTPVSSEGTRLGDVGARPLGRKWGFSLSRPLAPPAPPNVP